MTFVVVIVIVHLSSDQTKTFFVKLCFFMFSVVWYVGCSIKKGFRVKSMIVSSERRSYNSDHSNHKCGEGERGEGKKFILWLYEKTCAAPHTHFMYTCQ